MVLRNYCRLLIWMVLFGGVSLVFIPKREEIVLGKPLLIEGGVVAACSVFYYYQVSVAWGLM